MGKMISSESGQDLNLKSKPFYSCFLLFPNIEVPPV